MGYVILNSRKDQIKMSDNLAHSTSMLGVQYLSVDDARILLARDGIPQEDLDRYRNTVYASSASFWQHLLLLDRLGKLEVRDGRVYSIEIKPDLRRAV